MNLMKIESLKMIQSNNIRLRLWEAFVIWEVFWFYNIDDMYIWKIKNHCTDIKKLTLKTKILLQTILRPE